MIVPSIRQLAPHIGKSNTMLNRDFKKGKFRREPSGGFDVDKVRAALARSGDASQPSRQTARDSGSPEDLGGMAGTSYDVFNRARAVKELTTAKERQLNLRKRQGELLEEADVRRTWTETLARFENRLRQIPDILAPRVAVMDDVLEIRALIAEGIDAALRTLYENEADAA